MKKTTLLFTAISSIFIIACNNKNADSRKGFPKPGTLVASAEVPVTADTLNDFKFSVKVIADSSVKEGVYDVDVDYGPNFAEGKFTMPKGGEQLIPVIRKGTKPYTFVIGFNVGSDTTFYDYFEVSSTKLSTKMQYIKAYTF
jgi:hypothetical protein